MSIKQTSYTANMKMLLQHAGATIIDDMFISEPGVLFLKSTEISAEGCALFSAIGLIGQNYFTSAEFNSRLPSMLFGSPELPLDYSFCGDWHVSFLVAGISDENLKELVAHRECHISRLVSSNTRAQLDTYYVLQPGRCLELQRAYIIDFCRFRDVFRETNKQTLDTLYEGDKKQECVELWNSLNLPCKAAFCVVTMSLKDYHNFLLERLSVSGNETEIRRVALKICEQLHGRYPTIIMNPAYYIGSATVYCKKR